MTLADDMLNATEIPPAELMVRVTTWPSRHNPSGKAGDLPWSDLVAEVLDPPAERQGTPKADLPLWLMASFRERTEAEARTEWEQERRTDPNARLGGWGPSWRSLENLEAVSGLCLDLDNAADATPESIRAAFGDRLFVAHTTASHRPDAPRWRIMLPLARPVTPDEAEALGKRWAVRICTEAFRAGGKTDPRTGKVLPPLDALSPAQGMYRPAPGPHYAHMVNEGLPMSPDVALRELEPKTAPDPLDSWIELDELPDAWLTSKPPERPTLLHLPENQGKGCLLALGKVALLVAPGGAGKSQALADLAVAVASGGEWLQTYPVHAPGRVLLAYGEEDLDEAQRRLHGVAKSAGLLPDDHGHWADQDAPERLELLRRNLTLLPLYGCRVPLQDEEAAEGISAFGRDLMAKLEGAGPWAAVILDPGSRFMGADAETDNKAATHFIEILEQMTQIQGGPAVVLAHHANKSTLSSGYTDQGAARGSSALVDGGRWCANLESIALHGWARDGKAEREEIARRVLISKLGKPEGGKIRFLRLRVVKTNYSAIPEPLLLANWRGPLLPANPVQAAALKAAQKAAKKKLPEELEEPKEPEEPEEGTAAEAGGGNLDTLEGWE